MTGDREQRIETLCAAGKLGEAAAECAAAGQHQRAAELYERACDFSAAAEQALAAGDCPAAMRLVALSGHAGLTGRISAAVLDREPPATVARIAADLCARAYPQHGAVLYRGAGQPLEAAQAFERAGAIAEAAGCYDQAGEPAQAARLLEAALREQSDTAPDELRVALGELYARHGKHQAAVRALQQVGRDSPWRAAALPTLALSLEQVGLRQALVDLEPELKRHGVTADGAAPSHPSEAYETTLYGRYGVLCEVAVTPHARLLEAMDKLSGQRVAVKILASRARGVGRDALERFAREARALAKLRHPNVVPLHDFVAEGPAMVLAWMAGGSLRDLMDRETLSPARAAEIAGAVLGALGEAHRLGILHRDIKPSNLLFDEGGTARLADFGAAHMSESAATVTVGDIGTVAYMSPEQRRGQAATVRSDLYSLGVLLFEMLTGELPGGAPRVSPAHPDLDDSHDALLQKLLAEASEARFDGALQARQAIEACAWPTRIVERERAPAAALGTARPGDEPTSSERLVEPSQGAGGAAGALLRHDAWLGRDLWVLPLDDAAVARAAAFARAGHPALPAVLRADAGARQIWIEVPRGQALATGPASLSQIEAAHLREALEALHRAGGTHGAVDDEHVYRFGSQVALSYPLQVGSDATPASDLQGLDQLSAAANPGRR
ncbi:MAG: protein kinase [Deltaproteobacteria bacterium]|nr:protein kinase [Deltaproteobacteria bacterium]